MKPLLYRDSAKPPLCRDLTKLLGPCKSPFSEGFAKPPLCMGLLKLLGALQSSSVGAS